MPSTATITSFYSFAPLTKIRSAEVNSNFSIFRGHIIPVDPNTTTAASSGAYDLGSSDHLWGKIHAQEIRCYEQSTGADYVGIKAPNSLTASYDFILPPSIGTNRQYFKSDGSTTSFASFTPPTIQKFTSSSGTYTLPTGCLYIRVVAVGGGGGGAGSGTTGGTDGGAGGNTTFGTSLIVASGGAGGIKIGGAGGSGGGATLGSGPIGIAVAGSGGAAGNNQNATNQTCAGGHGGPSALGGGAKSNGYNSAGSPGETNSGGGGSGGGSNNVLSSGSGGGGGSGGYVDAIITSPSSSYSYAVGAGGSTGTAGTSGLAGGAGAAGQIIVYEYYH